MSRTTLSLTCLWWLTLTGVAAAQSGFDDPGIAALQDFSGGVTLGGSYFQVQNMTGNGVGYSNGFTQLGHMMPWWVSEDFVIAANNRLIITDNQQIGGNIGGFARYYNSDYDRIIGANLFYDIDQSQRVVHPNFQYRQVGFGFETLGQWWDIRANGYVPIDPGNNFSRALSLGNELHYFGNRVGFLGLGEYEEALWGGDIEFGVPLTPYTPWLRGYAGGYAYHSKGVEPNGVRTRIEGWISDDLNLGVQYTHDRQFGSNVNATVNFLFSGWKPTRWFPNFTTHERMLIPVQRNWRIATGTYEQIDEVPAYNPRTNQPYFITWVDNSQTPPGDGTYENPLTAMPLASPEADLILVRTGTTSALFPLQSAITLTDWQRMLGEGREHQFRAYANYGALTIPEQTFNLPEFTNTGNYPFLTSLANTITLADNNEVSAFNLINALGRGITNLPAGSNNFDVNYVNASGNLGGGIILTQATGLGRFDHVNALNNLGGGIGVDSGFAPLHLTFDDVTSNSVPGGVQLFGISINADNGSILADLTNVTANGNQSGIVMTEFATRLTANLQDVRASNNVGPLGDGIRVIGIGGDIDLAFDDVTTNNNGANGITVSGLNTRITFAGGNLTSNGNVMDNINFTLTGGTLTGGIQDSHFDGSLAGNGISFTAAGALVGTLLDPFVLRDVTANGNFLDGLHVDESAGATVALFIDPSHFDNNRRDGVHFTLRDGSNFAALFENDTINHNDRSAIYGNVDLVGTGNSTVSLTLTNTPSVDSGADGLYIQSANGANIFITDDDGDFSRSGRLVPGSSGLRFDAVDSNINLVLNRTFARNNLPWPAGPQAYGLQLNLNNTQFQGDVTDGNFSNNLSDGILADVTNGSAVLLNLTNVDVDGNGGDGMKFSSSDGSAAVVNAAGTTSFVNNGRNPLAVSGNGINLSVDGTAAPGSLTVNLPNILLSGNRDSGIFGTATGTNLNGGFLNINATDGTTINNNGGHGVTLVNNAGVINAVFEDTDISFNGGHGVSYFGQGTAVAASQLSFSHFGVIGLLGTTDSNAGNGLNFRVTAGSQLALSAEAVSFSSNNGYGIDGLVDGPGSIVFMTPFQEVVGDFNNYGGMYLRADNGSYLNANVNGGSFANNGAGGIFNGVQAVADNSALAILCFDGTIVDSNTGNGFVFAAHNNAELDVALSTSGAFGTLSASNNGLQAVVFTLDSGASGNLFMSGANEFNGNGSANAITYIANSVNQAAFSFSGTSDNNLGDAISVQMTDVAQAYIDIHGPGSLSGNGSNGIDITLNNVVFGTVPLGKTFLQGDFTANPFNISDLTISNNGEEGVKITGTNVTMVAEGTITGNTVAENGTDGILLDLTGGGNTIATLTLDSNDANNNQANGIDIQANAGSTFGTLNITNNLLTNNLQNGLYLNLNGSAITNLNIAGNTITGNGALGGGGPPGGSEFNIDVIFNGGLTPSQQAIFATAAARWAEIITGDLVDVGAIDDVQIVAEGVAIDGSGGILGQAGPTAVRPITFLPYAGIMQFDTADLADLEASGDLQDVILHEMAHVLGFGTIWDNLGLLVGGGGADPSFIGTNATAEHNARFGTSLTGVPVENTGGPGTADGHWRETVYTNELMTGFISGAVRPISRTTVGQFDDLGYTVDYAQADPFLTGGGPSTPLVLGDVNRPTLQVGTLTQLAVAGQGAFGSLSSKLITPASSVGDGIHIELVNSTITNTLIDGNTIDTNTAHGINYAVVSNSTLTNTTISNNSANSNGADGVVLTLTNSTVGDLTVETNVIDENTGIGLNVVASNTPINTLNIIGNGIHDNTSHGVNLDLTGSPIGSLNIIGNQQGSSAQIGLGFQIIGDTFTDPFTITNTSDPGIDITSFTLDIGPSAHLWDTVEPQGSTPFTPVPPTDLDTGLATVNGNPYPNTIPGGGVPDDQGLLDLTFTDFNATESFQWIIDADPLGGTATVLGSELVGSTINVNFTGGLFLTGSLQPLGTDGSQFIATGGNQFAAGISGNDGDGIRISQVNSNIGSVVIDNNGVSENQGHGINFETVSNSNIGPITVSNNTINGNGGDGFRLVDPNTINKVLDLTFTDNPSISGNTGNGVNLQISNGENVTLAMTGNTIGTADDANGGMGVRAVFSNGSLNAAIGNSGVNANTFTNNGDAGFGLIMSGTSTGSITVVNSSFNGSVDATDTTFAGVGLGISLTDSAVLNSVQIGDPTLVNTSFNDNASHGFTLETTGTSQANNVTVQNVTATGNGGNGLNFNRAGASTLGPVAIDNATLTGNAGNGIQITAADLNATDTYVITDSTITDNTLNGVLLSLVGDADLDVSILNTTISDNTLAGIQSTTNADITDTPTLLLNVAASTINGNGTNGISILTPHLINIDGNTINGNTEDGINLGSSSFGTDQITNNTIRLNGDDGIDITGNVIDVNIDGNTISDNSDDGIAADSAGGGAQQIITINDNTILSNDGDGIQIASRLFSGTPANPNTYVITNNLISQNLRRGINMVNAGGTNGSGGTAVSRTVADLTINANTISLNQLEGVYIINTASEAQATADNIDNLASAALLADGSVFAKPLLNLTMNGNSVNSNGQSHQGSDFIGTTGLVLRVGTSDATTSFTNDGGVASADRGGVVASINDNIFAGQYGADVTFHAFISTDDPATTAGTWVNDNAVPANSVFTVTSYVQDPLARLDLLFTGNTGNGIVTDNGLNALAFYDNAEPVFKSRDVGQVNPGPFDAGGTRARNATRQASRAGFPAPLPNVGASGSFLYPGVSATSTFRIQAGSDTTGFTIGDDGFGSSVPIGGATGELDFIWTTF